ncbi:MAG: hypothetical protein LBE06_03670 [Azoarcus sp.]|nr:hypothetical protein [Azoarcus sp.]
MGNIPLFAGALDTGVFVENAVAGEQRVANFFAEALDNPFAGKYITPCTG